MSYRYRKCRVCRGAMDPEEGIGGVCDECIQKEAEELARMETVRDFFDPGMQTRFKQMRMEEFSNA